MKPKNDSTAPASAYSAARSNLRSMMKAAIAPSISPASVRAAAEQLHAVVDHAVARQACRGRPASADVPAAASAPSTWLCAQVAMLGSMREDHRRRVTRRRGLERLRADHQADIQKYRQDRHQRHHREQQRGQAEEADQRDDDAGRERIADPPADRLPAGMADIDRRREWASRAPRRRSRRCRRPAAPCADRKLSPAAEALSTLFMPSVKL